MTYATDLKAIATRLDTDSETPWRTVTLKEARAVLEVPEARAVCGIDRAVDFAEVLLGLYPSHAVNNPKVFTAGLSKLLAAYPTNDVIELVDPLNGLASTLKFIPTIAECRAFLDGIAPRRTRIIANARYIATHHENLKLERDADAKYREEQAKLTPEKRAEIAARMSALVQNLRSKQDVAA